MTKVPFDFNRKKEADTIEAFLTKWGQVSGPQKLHGRIIDLSACDLLAECVEIVLQSIIIQYHKMARPDVHKKAAIRSLVLYSFCEVYILSPSHGRLAPDLLKDIKSHIAVDAFITALPKLDKSAIYKSKTKDSERRYKDTWAIFAAERPSIFSMSMIGFYLEREFHINPLTMAAQPHTTLQAIAGNKAN